MSTPPRRSRRSRLAALAATAAPSPDTPPPTRLLDLPTELLERALSRCNNPADIARVAAVSLLFYASLAVEAIRLWAQERGFELPAQPEGEGCAVRWLCFAALLCESNLPAKAAAGARHSIFIDGEGRLSSCGNGGRRRLAAEDEEGEEDEEDEELEFTGLLGHGEGVLQLKTPTRLPPALGGERAVSVSAGYSHSFALTADGAVWSWGDGYSGRLGHGDEQHQLLPKKIEAFAGQQVIAVSAGNSHSLALTADGALWSWGNGYPGPARQGQLGHGDAQDQWQPKKIEALAGQHVVAVTVGGMHSLALTADGGVWSWGYGACGQLGHGNQQKLLLPKKIQAFAGRRVVAVSAGGYHSLAITAGGAVWSFGYGYFGQLGHGDMQDRLLPKKVEALAGQRVIAVSAGYRRSFAITADGAVWSWGDGDYGRLGHGDEQRQLLPKKVEAFAGQCVVAVSAGTNHSLATTADGAILAWGEGERGCLGHGEDLSNQLLPKKIEVWSRE